MEHPVDGIEEKAELAEDGTPREMKTLFYLVAVPSYFTKGLSRYHVYQLISNFETTFDEKQTIQSGNILKFNIEFSPITENVTQTRKNIVDFLVSICAIIGGVYTLAGIVDSMIYKSVSYVFKNRIGKLA